MNITGATQRLLKGRLDHYSAWYECNYCHADFAEVQDCRNEKEAREQSDIRFDIQLRRFCMHCGQKLTDAVLPDYEKENQKWITREQEKQEQRARKEKEDSERIDERISQRIKEDNERFEAAVECAIANGFIVEQMGLFDPEEVET